MSVVRGEGRSKVVKAKRKPAWRFYGMCVCVCVSNEMRVYSGRPNSSSSVDFKANFKRYREQAYKAVLERVVGKETNEKKPKNNV